LALSLSLFLFGGCSGSGSGSGSASAGDGNQQQSSNPTPHVDSISPASVTAGASAQTITLTGSGFVQGAVVSFNGTAVPTTFTSATSLQAQVPASAFTGGVLAPVTVTNPSPGGGASTAMNFSVMSPTPQITGLSPSSVPQATAASITISGSGFESNSSVLWNGTAVPTTFVNSTTLQVSLTADQVKSLGSAQITVNNPGPGGTTTTPVAVVIYPLPTVSSVTPSSIPVGYPSSVQITVTGTNFLSGSVVLLDTAPLATTYVSATTLTAVIPATALANGRTATIAVQNPNPLAGASSTISLSITGQIPALSSVAPNTVAQGASGATITLTGIGFVPGSVAQWNGSPRTTTYVNSTRLSMALTASDLASIGSGQVTVTNPAPNGNTSSAVAISIVAPPVISSISPSTVQASSTYSSTPTTTLTVNGSNFASNAMVTLNGVYLTISSQSATQIVAAMTPSQLYTSGAAQVIVWNPSGTGSSVSSQPATLNIINPTGSFTVNPNGAAVGSADLKVSLSGSGFFPDSVVQWNGNSLPTTYTSSNNLSAVIPASLLAIPGTATISVLTPENQGAQSFTTGFSTYVVLPINDIAWNRTDGLLYATIAGRAGNKIGNSLVAIDPVTGVVQRTIFVGSEPNRLAISNDGTQAFVGLDGAGAVRQVNLQTGTAGVQFNLGGSVGVYNPPNTAKGLAAVPGQPNSVAVYTNAGVVTIYDSGVARAKTSSGLNTYFTSNSGGLAFGSSASSLYLAAYTVGSYSYILSVDNTGVTAAKQLSTGGAGNTIQYDNGRLYFSNGVVADATTGNTLGQFSVGSGSSTVAAQGPVVSDSALNLAWVVPSNYGSTSQLISYSETNFNSVSSIAVTGIGNVNTQSVGIGGNPQDLVRWGQNGLAFHTSDQLYILHGAIVKDTSNSPADVKVTAQVPATVTTGTSFSYQLQVSNQGPNDAQGVMLTTSLPGSLIYGSSTASQGSCSGNGVLYCDLGMIPNGSSATVTVNATPSIAGSIQINAGIDSQSYDPSSSNNQTSATTTASGSLYSPVPQVSSLSPNMVAAGSASYTLTVNGSNFTTASTVHWNGSPLPTTLVNSGQLTATVDSSLVAGFGWAQVTVTSAAPGGGKSGALTESIYSLLSVPANAMVWDPYTRKLYAVLPSTSTTIAGNSVVSIDPLTGSVSQPINVGSEPNLVAETTSGNYLYLGLSGAKSLARFNMATHSLDFTVPLTYNNGFGGAPTAANGLAILPGLDNSIAVDNIGIMDFNGSTPTTRPNSSLGYNDAVFPDAGHAYTYDNASTGAELYRYTVDSSGVHLVDGSTMLGMGGFSGSLALDQGVIYGSAGGLIDPSTTPPSQIGVISLGIGPYSTGLAGGGVVPYAAAGKSFNVGINTAGTWLVFLERLDTQHFTVEDMIQFPTNNSIVEGVTGTRWGQDGLAYIVTGGVTGNAPSQIFLLRGPFVLPSEGTANLAPTLTSVGSGTVAVGSGNQRVTVTGTGFLPGASIVWNGVVHDTTFVDAQHLSVAVPAAEVASAASISVTCRNPGSGDSNSVTVTVQ
jgi:trimeric autotransporter adhesin